MSKGLIKSHMRVYKKAYESMDLTPTKTLSLEEIMDAMDQLGIVAIGWSRDEVSNWASRHPNCPIDSRVHDTLVYVGSAEFTIKEVSHHLLSYSEAIKAYDEEFDEEKSLGLMPITNHGLYLDTKGLSSRPGAIVTYQNDAVNIVFKSINELLSSWIESIAQAQVVSTEGIFSYLKEKIFGKSELEKQKEEQIAKYNKYPKMPGFTKLTIKEAGEMYRRKLKEYGYPIPKEPDSSVYAKQTLYFKQELGIPIPSYWKDFIKYFYNVTPPFERDHFYQEFQYHPEKKEGRWPYFSDMKFTLNHAHFLDETSEAAEEDEEWVKDELKPAFIGQYDYWEGVLFVNFNKSESVYLIDMAGDWDGGRQIKDGESLEQTLSIWVQGIMPKEVFEKVHGKVSQESLSDKLKSGYSWDQAMKDYPSLEAFMIALEDCPECIQAAKQSLSIDKKSLPIGENNETSNNTTFTYDEGNGKKELVKLTGPLSEIMTQSLNIAFAKKPVFDKEVDIPDGLSQQDTQELLDSAKITPEMRSAESFQQEEQEIKAAIAASKLLMDDVGSRYDFISDNNDTESNPQVVVSLVKEEDLLKPQVVDEIHTRADSEPQAHNLVMVTDKAEYMGVGMGIKRKLVSSIKDEENISTKLSIENLYTKEGITVLYGLESFLHYLHSRR